MVASLRATIPFPEPILSIRPYLAAAAMFAFSSCAFAGDDSADDTIATDRPDFVESSQVVGRGRLQIETSVAVERDGSRADRQTAWSTPTLVRFGVSDNFELRVETDGAIRQRSTSNGTSLGTERGYSDVSLGMKWHIADAVGNAPSLGLLLHADLSSGSAAFREEGTRPSARLVAEWELPNEYSLGIMPGIGRAKSDGGHTFGILGVVLGKAWNDRFRSFIELTMPHIAKADHGGTEASFDAGAAYLIKKNVQVDFAVSHGLNSRAPDLSLTFGLSFKL